MSDFNVRSDSVDVEQIMEQIRARIREKRGVDYTEQQLKELAAVKLEKFLDPRGVRSDLLERFKRREPLALEPPLLPTYAFEDETIYETHRGVLRFIRRLLNPLLKLLFNPNAIIRTLHQQADINRLMAEREYAREQQRREVDTLYYEVVHNLVVEVTKSALEVKNLKMRVESLASRLEFSERRARALEGVVAYKSSPHEADAPPVEHRPRDSRSDFQPPTPATPASTTPSTTPPSSAASGAVPSSTGTGGAAAPEGPGQRSRRRRRRRGRRSNVPATTIMGGPGEPQESADSDADDNDLDGGPDNNSDVGSDTGFDGGPESGSDAGPQSRAADRPDTPPAGDTQARAADTPTHSSDRASHSDGDPDPQ